MHTATLVEFVEASEGSLAHVAAECSCGHRVTTTLGAGAFNRTESFARQELAQHTAFMNAKEAK
jgi:hypothetical protein